MLNLDTHILLYALDGSLTPAERKLLASEPWGISAIVLWEVAKLAQLGRIAIDIQSASFAKIFARVHIWPLNLDVCEKSTQYWFPWLVPNPIKSLKREQKAARRPQARYRAPYS